MFKECNLTQHIIMGKTSQVSRGPFRIPCVDLGMRLQHSGFTWALLQDVV